MRIGAFYEGDNREAFFLPLISSEDGLWFVGVVEKRDGEFLIAVRKASWYEHEAKYYPEALNKEKFFDFIFSKEFASTLDSRRKEIRE
jgi:hypothetical protein